MNWHALLSLISLPSKTRYRKSSYRPGIDILEDRLTPTTLLPGFTESTVASGLSGPTAMEFSPDGRLWVLEGPGNVKLVHNDGTTFTALHLNVDASGLKGLMGIAFDPNFASNHFAYLYYTNPNPGTASWATGEHMQLSRFTVNDANPLQPTFTSEAPILDLNNLIGSINHLGGAIHFGNDGMLYVDTGDDGQTFIGPDGNSYAVSQTLANMLGKQLRIDVSKFNSGAASRDDETVGDLIPANNPFVGQATGINQLIYVLGLRNPFTFAVQPGTGRMLINDVGEDNWEEIDDGSAGSNYGWSGGNSDGFGHPPPSFAPGTYHDPLLAYTHSGSASLATGDAIAGGTFYNPATAQFPSSYVGMYFYQDLDGGWIRYFNPNNPNASATPDGNSVAFASNIAGGLIDLKIDSAGNLYYLSYGDGGIHKIAYVTPPTVQIGDDSSSQVFATTGSWVAYSGSGPMYDGNMHYEPTGTGANVATWTFTVTPGQFRVSATWWAWAGRASNAPYTVLDESTSRGTVLVNQQLDPSGFSDQGGTWQDLGTFTILGNQLLVQLSDNADGYVIADAIRVERLGNAATVQVQDGATPISNGGSDSFGTTTVGTAVTRTFTVTNAGARTITLGALGTMPAGFTLTQGFGTTTLAAGVSTTFQVRLDATVIGSYGGTVSFTSSDPNFSSYSWSISGTVQAVSTVQIGDDSSSQVFATTGSWVAYSGSGPMYAGNMHYASAGTGSNVASWSFTVTPGQYRVSTTWWAWSNRAGNAPYTVLDGPTSQGTVLVNQQAAPLGFSDQGSSWQDLGTFTITGNQLVVQLSDNADGYVIADAIRIERLGNAATVQVQDGATSISNGGSDSFGNTNVGTPVTRTFTVTNAGAQTITLGALGAMPAGFTLTQGFGSTTLVAGASTTFQARLDATEIGSYSGTLSFTSSDPNFSSYSWSISGTVQAVSTVQIGDDSSSQVFATTGSWVAYSGSGPMYAGNMHYAAAGTGSNVASWSFTVTPGQYRVSTTWWAWSNRASNAPYTVLDGPTSQGTVLVNQQAAPSGFADQGSNWQDLGTFTITGNQLVVQLSDNANGYVIADAERIQKVS